MQAVFEGIFMDITEPFKDHIKDNIYIYITCMQKDRRNKQVPFADHLVYKFLGTLFLRKYDGLTCFNFQSALSCK